MTLSTQPNVNIPVDDDYTAASVACDGLKKAVDTTYPQQIQLAATNLRSILARLGRPPASPQEQLAALEEKTAGLSGLKLFSKLPQLAKRAANAGEMDKAQKLMPSNSSKWRRSIPSMKLLTETPSFMATSCSAGLRFSVATSLKPVSICWLQAPHRVQHHWKASDPT